MNGALPSNVDDVLETPLAEQPPGDECRHVTGEYNSALSRSPLEDRRILGSRQSGILNPDKVEIGLTPEFRANDVAMDTFVTR